MAQRRGNVHVEAKVVQGHTKVRVYHAGPQGKITLKRGAAARADKAAHDRELPAVIADAHPRLKRTRTNRDGPVE